RVWLECGVRLERDIDAEVRTDLVAEVAPDAVLFVGDVHGKPPDAVGRRTVGEDIGRAYVQAEPARLAHVLTDDDVPLPGRPLRRLLVSLEQRHRGPPG